MRHLLHKAICWYLHRCAGAFHCYPYGDKGRYVVLMNEGEYHHYTTRCRYWHDRDTLFQAISSELDHAYAKHGRLPWGRHEFYAILLEEVDELWDEIKADTPQEQVEKEAIQVAAMVFRYLETGDRYRK